ncbi:MAG: ribosome recycling factor [Planctomycetes bacterium]|jgi:ribosome recycling factor|nr:ribosome recycling factor [Planctomycetota bacterium]MBT6452889.1 ribosome recycling factor [Planctomycetota bacterium]MBT6541577.1 ribosome recycling factor [Planctomycetota bacterium]MBT6783694.1 ribosome recycling factor [Planctomycetota bacterium]MBT6967496.1 ribosome recycling factor [Planctomycetota bacterium]
MVEEVILDAEERMSKALDHLREEMRGMRTGRAHPGLVESIRVDYYGTPTPLKQLANISVPEPDQLVIKPFDVSAMSDIEKGIQSSDLGITPQNDGKLIRLRVPPLSEERRKQMVSRAKEVAEESKISMRNIRRDANKHIDTSKKDGDLSEDDQSRFKDQVQEVLKTVEKQVDADLKRKTEELMEI